MIFYLIQLDSDYTGKKWATIRIETVVYCASFFFDDLRKTIDGIEFLN